jgi:tRNA pseudouridine38-40 synthase
MSRIDLAERGHFLEITLTANAFLHHMVRNIVGALVHVGSGRQSPQWMADLLIARRRALGAPTFSPAGLYLAGVDYDPAMGLPGGSHDPLDPPGILPDVSEGAVA